jgi:hypothetical protein|tara:strand:- start:320 stop:811 length:492 start_codon:yes stop_codon:yes gene_type:complete
MGKVVLYFGIGILIVLLLALVTSPISVDNINGYFALDLDKATEVNSPSDRIKEDQIKVYNSLVIMDIERSELVSLEDTNSMDPLIDEDSNILQIMPESPEDINVGDIVSYQDDFGKVILHRVVEISEDSEGKFFVLKGDNNDSVDDSKVRFEQIKGVLVAIVY